jgi:hypothetical protein
MGSHYFEWSALEDRQRLAAFLIDKRTLTTDATEPTNNATEGDGRDYARSGDELQCTRVRVIRPLNHGMLELAPASIGEDVNQPRMAAAAVNRRLRNTRSFPDSKS